MLQPRFYQSEAKDAAIAHMRGSSDPSVLELCTAAGKSIIVGLIAEVVNKAKKRVLVLQPNGDLCQQNAAKYKELGGQCSIFSASLNRKQTHYPVVFATPLSVVKSMDRFDDEYALVVIDECDSVAEDQESSYQQILTYLRERNPRLRVLGLTATPMRGKHPLVGDEKTFKSIIYKLPHNVLSKLGYVVPYRLGLTHDHYELAKIKVQSNGKFKASDVAASTEHKERLTRAIVKDAIAIMDSQDRRCAFFFASSIKHAEEVCGYIHETTGCKPLFVTGKTAKQARSHGLSEARQGRHRYVVTVSALGVGTDVPICDTVVFMMATEAPRKLIQFMGRGCRLYGHADNWQLEEYGQDGKKDCLVLDYGENLERHGLDDDLTITDLVKEKVKQDEEYFEVDCPICATVNKHTAGRCVGVSASGTRCDYRFVFKECGHCGAENAPSARNCFKCGGELIDPNAKLTRTAARPPGTPFDVAVQRMDVRPHFKNGEQMLRVDYEADGISVSEFFKPENESPWHRRRFSTWAQNAGTLAKLVHEIVQEPLRAPKTLTVKKEKGSKYYSVESRRY